MPRPPDGAFQILRAHLHAHASGDFAHRREQRQRAVALADGFVGHAVDFGGEQLVGEFGQGREVQVGEEDEVGAEESVLGRLRLFDFDDEIGALPDLRRGVEDRRAGLRVFLVGERTAFARVSLDQDFMARFAQRGNAAGHEPYACFVVFDFLRNADDHEPVLRN